MTIKQPSAEQTPSTVSSTLEETATGAVKSSPPKSDDDDSGLLPIVREANQTGTLGSSAD